MTYNYLKKKEKREYLIVMQNFLFSLRSIKDILLILFIKEALFYDYFYLH